MPCVVRTQLHVFQLSVSNGRLNAFIFSISLSEMSGFSSKRRICSHSFCQIQNGISALLLLYYKMFDYLSTLDTALKVE